MPAMFSSHTMITGGTFTQIHTSRGSIERLLEAASPAAFHNSGERRDPPKCHPKTRLAVLEKIKDWILSLDPETRSALIMWLHGPAGSGKSAIAQTIAEWAFEEGILLSSFFFSRFDSSRNHPRSLIATIAYQATTHFTEVRDHILAAMDADPLIFTRSLMTQIRTVIVEPLRFLITSGYFNDPRSKRLVIIDGLDECEDRDGQMDILHTIAKALQDYHLPLIFLLVSRPEHDITHSFGSGYLREIATRLPLDYRYEPFHDIKLFLRDEFVSIKERHPFKAQIPPEWPTEENLQYLIKKSSGQFIYAATVIKFVKSTRHRPVHRLDMVLGLRPTAGGRDMPFAELDALYHHVFSLVQDLESVLRVLAFYLLRPTNFRGYVPKMEQTLSLNPGDISVLFCDLHSVVKVDLEFRALYFLHASLEDFFLDESRSKELYIDAPIRHAEFALVLFPSPNFVSAFDLDVCAHHLERALPHEELRQQILDLDIRGVFRLPARQHVCLTFPRFLRSIKNSRFPDATALYLHHVQAFDKYAAEKLEEYYSTKRPTALVAALSACHAMKKIPILLSPKMGESLFQFDKKLKFMDLHGLNIIQAMTLRTFPQDTEYLVFLQDLLADKKRLGIHAPNPTTYANAATYFLRYIYYRLVRQMPRYPGLGMIICSLRNTPWKWHRMTAWNKYVYRKIPLNNRLRWWWGWGGVERKYFYDNEGECYFSLDFLGKILPKAGRSEELINLARTCNFRMLSFAFPAQTRVARREVALYLERMDRDDA